VRLLDRLPYNKCPPYIRLWLDLNQFHWSTSFLYLRCQIKMPKRFRRRKKRRGRGTATRALRLAKMALSAQERKFHVMQAFSAGLDSDGFLFRFTDITQGISDTQRVGDSLKVISLNLSYLIENSSTTLALYARVIVFWDKQNQVTSAADLLQTTGSIQVINSYKAWDTRFRSNVLFDRVHKLSMRGLDNSIARVRTTLKVRKHIQYIAGGAIADTGGLKMIVLSEEPAPAVNIGMNYYARVQFVDG